jgi:hypothetical protein
MSRLPDNSAASLAHGEESPNLRRLVLIGCGLAILVFIAAIGVLYSGWFGHENPNALIVVQGEPTIADAMVSVRPVASDARAVLKAQFKTGIENRLRFHVPQGRYEITVQAEGLSFRPQQVDALSVPVILEISGRGASSRPAARSGR